MLPSENAAGTLQYVQELVAHRADSLMSGCYAPSCIALILAPYVFIVASLSGRASWAQVWTVSFLLLGWWLALRLRRHSDRIYAGLKRSCFILRLAAGPQELDMIYSGVPALAALMLIGPKPADYRGWARLVVHHIDYYALPEQSAATMRLKSLLYMVIPPVAAYLGTVFFADPVFPLITQCVAIVTALITLAMVIVHTRAMRAASIDALSRYLDNEITEESL